MNTKEFKSEWQWQKYYLKSILSNPKELAEDIHKASKRSVFIFFFNIQLVYLLINYIYQLEFVSNHVSYLQSTNTLATYFPSFELYFGNTLFYISFLIVVHFAGFLLLLATTSFIISLVQDTSFKETLKTYVLFFSLVPILLFNKGFLLASILIMITANGYITQQTNWKQISKLSSFIPYILLIGVFFTLFLGQVL